MREELVAVKRTKRRKVQNDPDVKFATIHTIRRVQMETGRVTVEDLALETDFQKSPGKSSVSILGFDVDNLN